MTTKLSDLFLALKSLLQNLWLSITSVNFYQDVYSLYKGYGIRYIFTISFISSLIFCVFIFNYMIAIKDYLQENQSSKNTDNLDYILRQLPDINYDGKNISLNDGEPIYLYDVYDRKIAVIDSANKISFNEKSKIPIIFTNKDIIISLIETTDNKNTTIPISYQTIFGLETELLTNDVIKKNFAALFDNIPRLFTYLVMPILMAIRFVSILFEKSFIIILIYLLTNFIAGPKTSMQTCIRVVLFSSGFATLIQPIIILLLPALSNSIWMLQMWCNLLLFLAIFRIRNSRV